MHLVGFYYKKTTSSSSTAGLSNYRTMLDPFSTVHYGY